VVERFLTDVRRAFQQARRSPGYAAAVIATLALTVGASTTLFSLYNALVLRTLPVQDPSRIVLVQPTDDKGQNRPLYQTMHRELARLDVFEHLALFSGGGMFFTEARGVRAQGLIESVTPGFHEALGLRPFLGRYFTERDQIDVDSPTVVLSHALWGRLFNDDPSAIGEQVLIDGKPMTVIGVTPPEFKGFYVDGGFGFSVPISVLNRHLGTDPKSPIRGLQAVGRLKAGVTIAQAHTAVDATWRSIRGTTIPPQLPAAEQREIATHRIKVETLASGFSGLRTRYAQALQVLLAITVVLVVIGCVNLSGLLLARTMARERQFAIMLALGAARAQFAQQVLVESVILAMLGTVVALPLAWMGSRMLSVAIWDLPEPLAMNLAPDMRVIAAAAIGSIVSGLIIGALPAARAARRRRLGLRSERSIVGGSGKWRRALLVVQIALCLVLVAGAGLFGVSLWNLRTLDTGFTASDVRWARLFAVPGGYRNQDDAVYYPELLRQIEALPEVRSVAMSSMFPTFFNAAHFLQRHAVVSLAQPNAPAAEAIMESVTPGFFRTMGIPLLQGRDVSWSDQAAGAGVVILNHTVSRQLFPDGNAIGQHVRIGNDPKRAALQVIGVAADASVGDLRAPHAPAVFRPRMQEQMRAPVLLYEPAADGPTADAAVTRVVSALGHEYPRGQSAVSEFANRALIQERLLAGLSGMFAALALLLAVVGLHGSLVYDVTQRTREIGVRMAIGASRRDVIGMIVRDGAAVAAAGALLGIVVTFPLSSLVRSMVFGLEPTTPWIALAAAACLVAVGIASCLWPAARAAAIDPATALRVE
jgi:predicted permease